MSLGLAWYLRLQRWFRPSWVLGNVRWKLNLCAIVFKHFSRVKNLDVQRDWLAVLQGWSWVSGQQRTYSRCSVKSSLAFSAFAFSYTLCPTAAFQMPPRGMNWDQNPGSCLLLLVFCGLYILKPQQLATGLVSLKEQVMKAAPLSRFPGQLTKKTMTPPQTDSSVWVICSHEKNVNKTEKQRLISPTCGLWGAN